MNGGNHGTNHGGNHGGNHSDGFKVQHSTRKVTTGTGSGGKITSAMTTKQRSVFLSNLSVSVEDTELSDHLIGCGVLGARFRKVSPRGATSKSYKEDVSEQFYNKLLNLRYGDRESNCATGTHIRTFFISNVVVSSGFYYLVIIY